MCQQFLWDTHAHLDDAAFDADRDELLTEIGKTMAGIIDPGCDLVSSQKAMALSHTYPFIWAAVGIHPEDIGHASLTDLKQIAVWCKDPKVVAIGEVGLDYYNDEESPHDLQQEFLIRQFDLAREAKLPLIIHDREAHADIMAIIREHGEGVKGVLHCFSGDWSMAEEALARGWYLGFGGTSTFKNDRGVREILRQVPLDRILFETDSPYMAPVPFRGKRNTPLYTHLVAEKAAELRDMTSQDIIKISTNNMHQLFWKIPKQQKTL